MRMLGTQENTSRRRRTAALAASTAVLSAALVAASVGPADAGPAKGDRPGVAEKTGYVHVRIVTKTIEHQKFSAGCDLHRTHARRFAGELGDAQRLPGVTSCREAEPHSVRVEADTPGVAFKQFKGKERGLRPRNHP